ncbi:MAG: signal peptidase I [Spirochaetes bacterium]|nr:signal peptidase I [Spirochaetota bacterium]
MQFADEKTFGVPKFIKFFISIAGIIAGLILTRLFFLMPFIVQDDSMEPTLHKGDYLLILKIGSPEQGDIVLAESPVEQDKVILKRLIASGEKKIEVKNKKIFINSSLHNDYAIITDRRIFPGYFSKRDNMEETTIKKDEVFLLGDNLDHSMDSREIGPVKKNALIGRMIYKF